MIASVIAGIARWTEDAYLALFQRKQCQIAVDNAVLRIARLDAALFEGVLNVEQTLRKLHRAHHPLHACARNPALFWKCGAPDELLEAHIRLIHRTAFARAQLKWIQNPVAARGEWARLNLPPGTFSRAIRAPVVEKICQVCGLPAGWQWQPEKSKVRASGPHQCEAAESEIRWRLSDSLNGSALPTYRMSR